MERGVRGDRTSGTAGTVCADLLTTGAGVIPVCRPSVFVEGNSTSPVVSGAFDDFI